MNWITPKIIAFSSPSEEEEDEEGYKTFTPDDYSPVFQRHNIGTIIRLNNRSYNEQRFVDNGFKFEDLYFVDGTCPSKRIIKKFLTIAEAEEKGIAIHCKAGLGRTGALIGLYWMKHYGFPAAAFIGWIRICRPGSVLGPQQHFLLEMEKEMFEQGGIKEKSLTDGIENISLEENKYEQADDDKDTSYREKGLILKHARKKPSTTLFEQEIIGKADRKDGNGYARSERKRSILD